MNTETLSKLPCHRDHHEKQADTGKKNKCFHKLTSKFSRFFLLGTFPPIVVNKFRANVPVMYLKQDQAVTESAWFNCVIRIFGRSKYRPA
jgi:hypothetical protein